MADAEVTRSQEKTSVGRRGRSVRVLRVEYDFTEANGTRRSERDDLPVDWSLPADGNITVQYLPGAEHS